MEALKNLVKLGQEVHPELGTYIHLCRAVRGTGTKRAQLFKLFNQLMPEEEYDKSEKVELVDYLEKQSIQDKDILDTD